MRGRAYASGIPPVIAPELPFADRTFPRMLALRAQQYGDRTLVRHPTGELTFAQARELAACFAGTLVRAGVGPGDRVAIIASNRVEFLQTWLASAWLGAILAPVNTASRGAQLEHVLTTAAPRVLVVEAAQLEQVAALEQLPESLERIWVIGTAAEDAVAGVPLEAFPAASDPVEPHAVRPGDTLMILFTSGTTGPSKGVQCPHAQLYWYGLNTVRHLGVTGDDVLYTVLPLFHVNALNTFVQALLTGATYHLGTRFSASRFWSELADSRATVTFLLGAMIHILLKREPTPEERAHRLRIALSPATPLELVDVVRERFGFQVVEGYASTETNVCFSNLVGGYEPATMGRPLPGFEARVVDDADNELPAGVPGELILRHSEPFAFATGYFRMPEQTVEAWRNLWFHTGDRVVRDERGVYRFLDRIKDAIRRRGENISSYEVELALQMHDDVEASAVVPVPSELGEDEVMAFVVLREGAEPDPVALVRHCEPRLAYFAIPRFVEFVESLPLTENGKIRKYALRSRGVGPRTWDREAAGVSLGR